MTRQSNVTVEQGFTKIQRAKPQRSRFFRSLRMLAILSVLAIIVACLSVPFALSNAGLITKLVNQYAGLDPLHVDIGEIEIGWFSPLKLEKVRVMDAGGVELLRVDEIETQMSLLNLATNYSNIRNVYIRQIRLAVDVQPETTSLEEALQPLLAKWQSTEPVVETPASTSAISIEGTVQIENATVLARDSVTGQQWEFNISEAIIPIPKDFKQVPKVSLVGRVAQIDDAGNLILRSTGQFEAKVEPIANASNISEANSLVDTAQMHLTINTSGLPLEWMSLVKRRLGWFPIEQINGSATVQAEIDFLSLNSITANIATAQLDRVRIDAPEYFGQSGATMNQIRLAGDIRLSNNHIQTDRMQLTSDVGFIRTTAKVPWPFENPSLTRPWVPGADLTVDGEIDLARLLQVAPEIIALQDQTRLTSGKATLSLRHTQDKNSSTGMPRAILDIRLGALQAEYAGNQLVWDEALQVQTQLVPPASASQQDVEFQVNCKAEFCDIQGQGTLNYGQVVAKVDLDKLERRLSQWVKLPTESLSGSANATLNWQQQAEDRIIASAKVDTTALSVILPSGKLDEPAWQGIASATLQLKGLEVVQVDRAEAKLTSAREKFDVVMNTPLRFAELPAGSPPPRPTTAVANIRCDLAACLNRCKILTGVDPGVNASGIFIVQAESTIDNLNPVLETATFETTDLTLIGDGYVIREPRIQGNFRGRLDTNDIAGMQIDELIAQAESFALTAKDSASDQTGYLRNGQAAFRVDPARLMKSYQSTAVTTNGQPADEYAVGGDMTGQVQWWLNSKQADWQISVDAKDLVVSQIASPASSAAKLVSATTSISPNGETKIWEEPQVKMDAKGTYVFDDGSLDLPTFVVQSEWIAVAGSTQYLATKTQTEVNCSGQVTYDMKTVTERLKPYIGTFATVRGQRTEPFQFRWLARNDSTSSWTDSLTAKTTIGWDEAQMVGIVIGNSSVPISINKGVLVTATEIPISQGTLRWDLQSNLAAEPMKISQKPQTVLDHVAITPEMCSGWLKYIAPLVSEVAAVQGQLSLEIERAEISPFNYLDQTVAGKLFVHGANVGPGPLSDQLIGIARQIRAMRKGLTLDPSTINDDLWVQMPEQKISFTVDQGNITHRDVQLKIGDVLVTTSGAVSLDGKLQMVARVPIQQQWVAENQLLASLAGQTLDVPIGGTLQQPRLDFSSIGSVTQQLVTAGVQKAAQKQIDKGLNKLLGPLQNQLEPLQQQIQALPNQLPAMPQLPQLPNFGFPGFGAPAQPKQ